MNILSNWKSYLKFLERNQGYTAIELFGLSVSLLFVILIGVYVSQELSTDRFHEKRDRVYLIGSESGAATAAAIPYMLKERYPEIEAVCPVVTSYGRTPVVEWGGRRYASTAIYADSTFFRLFSFRLLEGDPGRVLRTEGEVVISRSFARRVFGDEPALGQRLLVGDTLRVTVSGVVEDLKNSCLPESDLILPWATVAAFANDLTKDNLNNAAGVRGFILAREGADLRARADDICLWMKDFFWTYQEGLWKDVRFETLGDYYFSGWPSFDGGLRQGDRRFVMVLLSVGVLILVFAVFNYINLTVAQAGFRAKEMAARRLFGATRVELFWRLVQESMMLCLIALAIAILLAASFEPYASDLLRAKLDLTLLARPAGLAALVGFVVLVGGLAGWFPAMVISAAEPIEVVRGTFRRRTKMVFSKVFITIQNFLTIIMLSASLVIALQVGHLIHAPLGYRTEGLYVVSLDNMPPDSRRAFQERARSIGGVVHVGQTRGLPMYGWSNWTAVYDDGTRRMISFNQFLMDREAFDMLGLRILQDNHVADDEYGYFINEEALRQMAITPETPSFALEGNEPIPVLGIVSDFRLGNILQDVTPVMVSFLRPDRVGQWMLVEFGGDPTGPIAHLRSLYAELSGGLEMKGDFLDQTLRQTFASQIRLTKIVGVFTCVAILISLLGLVAMSTYFVRQREVEIAVRKVYGSENGEILVRLVRSFLVYVGIAFVFAAPVAWWALSRWLSDYDYRVSLSPWMLLAAGGFCLVVAFCAVIYQSWQAANRDPVKGLKGRQ